MEHIITTYGAGEVFEYVFNGLAMLMKSDGGVLNPMSRIALSVGALYVTTVMFFNNDLRDGVWWVVWAVIATSLMTTIKTTVWIHDPLTNTKNKVDNVPFVLAVAASTVSTVGKTVTEKMESVFTLPDYMPYHKTGTVFASSLMSQTKNFRITDPEFRGNVERFVNQCAVLPAMIGTKFTMTELQNSQDIWGFLKERASPLLRFLYKKGNTSATFMTCKAGAEEIDKLWKQEIATATILYGQRINNQNLKKAAFDQYLTNSYQLLTGIASSAENILRQEMMINAIEEGSNNKLTELGGSANYAVTKALLQQRSTYSIAGDIAAKTLPLFKNVIEAIAYALFIFVVVLALLPNGWRILLTYFGILVWTQLWAPLYAVLNLIMTLYGRHETLACSGRKGLTMLTSNAIYSANADMTTLAAWLSISVPFISYGILKQGAGAFVNMAQSLGSAMQAASSGVAAETVSGNMSLGNVSLQTEAYQTKSAFQHNTSPSYSSGQMRSLGYDGMETISYADGSTSYNDQGVSQLPFKITATRDESTALQQQLAQAMNMAESQGVNASKAQSAAYDQTMTALKQMGQLYNTSEDYTEGKTASEAAAINKVANLVGEMSKSHGWNTSQALEAMVKGGVDTPFIGGGLSGSTGASSHGAHTKGQSLTDGNSHNVSLDEILTFGKAVTEHSGKSKEENLSESAHASLNTARSLTEQHDASLNRIKSLQESLTSTQQQGLTQSEDITQKVIDYMSDQMGAAETQKILREGIGSMEPWVNKYLAEHKEYKPGSINIGGEKIALEQSYIKASSNIASQTEKAISRDHALGDARVIESSKENGLNLANFNIESGLEEKVAAKLDQISEDIEKGSLDISHAGKNIERSITKAEQSTLVRNLAKNTIGLDIDKAAEASENTLKVAENEVPTTNMQRKN